MTETAATAAAGDGAERRGDVLVLFGVTGDLAKKMILPALYRLTQRGELTVPVIGVALTDWDTDALRKHVATSVHAAFDDVDTAVLEPCRAACPWWRATTPTTRRSTRWPPRCVRRGAPTRSGCTTSRCRPACSAGWPTGSPRSGSNERGRLVVEKPFGHDLQSALALNALVRRHFPEDRVFRVDHYLGKEPVEDLLVLRFANTLLQPMWDRSWVAASRSPWPRTSTSPTGARSTTPSAPSATSCRTTCSRCSAIS